MRILSLAKPHVIRGLVSALATLILAEFLQSAATAAEEAWVGKQVVPRNQGMEYIVDGKPYNLSQDYPHLFLVLKEDGDRLFVEQTWLHDWSPNGEQEKSLTFGGPSGWVRKDDVATVSEAIPFFTKRLREAKNVDAFAQGVRGICWVLRRDYENAVADLSEASSADRRAWLYAWRALARFADWQDYSTNSHSKLLTGNSDNIVKLAWDDLSTAIRQAQEAWTYRVRGELTLLMEHRELANRDAREAIRLEPDFKEAHALLGRYCLRRIRLRTRSRN